MTRCYRRVACQNHDKEGCHTDETTCVLCCHSDDTKCLLWLSWTSYSGMQHWRSDKGYQEVVGCKVCIVFTVIILIAATIWASLHQAYIQTAVSVGVWFTGCWPPPPHSSPRTASDTDRPGDSSKVTAHQWPSAVSPNTLTVTVHLSQSGSNCQLQVKGRCSFFFFLDGEFSFF